MIYLSNTFLCQCSLLVFKKRGKSEMKKMCICTQKHFPFSCAWLSNPTPMNWINKLCTGYLYSPSFPSSVSFPKTVWNAVKAKRGHVPGELWHFGRCHSWRDWQRGAGSNALVEKFPAEEHERLQKYGWSLVFLCFLVKNCLSKQVPHKLENPLCTSPSCPPFPGGQ